MHSNQNRIPSSIQKLFIHQNDYIYYRLDHIRPKEKKHSLRDHKVGMKKIKES